ncbi:MAG TPA: tetratricopeptide repeat protein, partial [Pseudomonadota bacterium]|nr:tetratricopeptide repeat protein [Pseudomonadota bacterium]
MLRKYLCSALLGLALTSPVVAFADEADAQYRKGLELMQQGKLDEAQASLEEALRIRPNYAAAQLTLGNVFRRQKKCDKAVTQYEAVIKTQPNDPFAHGN